MAGRHECDRHRVECRDRHPISHAPLSAERRAELAIIGQPANLAARLQEFTKVALTSDAGREILGEFKHSMALLEPNLVDGMESFKRVSLNVLKVRDFESLEELGGSSL